MSAVVYVPRDAAALSLGAERVASAIAREAKSRGIDVTLKRNGTRGMCWLEPLVEVVVGSERCGYGPVTERDVPALFAADFLNNGAHALQLGRVEDIAYFASQQRLTFERVGVIESVGGANDPLGRSVPPLTPVGPWRLQTTRTECWRRGCRALFGDRRGELRPHLAAHSHENGHNDGGERQAHQTSHKPAHRHPDIPNSRPIPATS